MTWKIVADTNLIISAAINPAGNPAQILDAVIDDRLILITSPAILDEVRRVFTYPRIRKWLKKRGVSVEDTEDYIEKLSRVAVMVDGDPDLEVIEDDPDDNMIVAAAVEGRADCIVSGDHHLTDLQEYQDIKILTPAAFLKEMEDQAYFHTKEWQQGEKEADKDIAEGRVAGPFESVDDLQKDLEG